MGLRFIPPGKKSLKKGVVPTVATPEVIEKVIETVESVVAEVAPVVETVVTSNSVIQDEPASTQEEVVQEPVEQKAVETSAASSAKRKK